MRRVQKAPKASKTAEAVRDVPDFVAKHMNSFNRATVEVDRKQAAKKNGFLSTKHKGASGY